MIAVETSGKIFHLKIFERGKKDKGVLRLWDLINHNKKLPSHSIVLFPLLIFFLPVC